MAQNGLSQIIEKRKWNGNVPIAQVIGTYTIVAASGGVVDIERIWLIMTTAGAGATATLTIGRSNGAANDLLASVVITTLTAGLNLVPLLNQFSLRSGDGITFTIGVANCTGGAIRMGIEYSSDVQPLAALNPPAYLA